MVRCWGVRSQRASDAPGALGGLVQRWPTDGRRARVRYVPVLSEPPPDWRGSRGFVHEAVLKDIDDLDKYDAYAAGSPAMITAGPRAFGRRGLAPHPVFFAFFDSPPHGLGPPPSGAPAQTLDFPHRARA